MAGLAVLTWLLTRRTALGLFVEAVGNNPTASTYAGINAARVKLAAYVFCGFCAGVAGIVTASTINQADVNNAGLYLELDAILAVVIGGTPLTGGRIHLLGSLLGTLLIQAVTTTILTRGVGVEYTLVLKAAVVVGVCLLQSEPFRQSLARRSAGGCREIPPGQDAHPAGGNGRGLRLALHRHRAAVPQFLFPPRTAHASSSARPSSASPPWA